MKILVSVKRVPDYATKLRVSSAGDGYETEGIKWVVNPFDEIAIEEAIRIKESGKATEVVAVSVGPADCGQQLLAALALGADRAILIKTDAAVDSDLAARAMEFVYRKELPRLVIMGKQATDSDSGQAAQIVATRLGIAQACFASKVSLAETSVDVVREIDGGLETVRVPLPCVISTDLRLNTPRYASVMGIMKAKKKPMETIELSATGIDPATKVRIRKVSLPEARKAGRKVASVQELVQVLKNEAKVI